MTTSFDDHEWQDRLSEYLDGQLSDAESRSLEEHLGGCERCRAALADLRAVVDKLHGDPVDAVSPDAWPRIANRLVTDRTTSLGDRGGRHSWALETRTLRRVAAAASFVLTFAGGIWIGALLCVARPVWTTPGWMHLGPRASRSIAISRAATVAPTLSDSIRFCVQTLQGHRASIP